MKRVGVGISFLFLRSAETVRTLSINEASPMRVRWLVSWTSWLSWFVMMFFRFCARSVRAMKLARVT